MTIRFQHLLDSHTEFKVAKNILTLEEKEFMASHRSSHADHYYVRYTYIQGLPKVTSTGNDTPFFESHEFLLFEPSTEPTLTITQILTLFLKKHRANSKFIANLKVCETTLDELIINSYDDLGQIINFSFYWDDTAQGYHYWDSLSVGWSTLVDDFNLNNRI